MSYKLTRETDMVVAGMGLVLYTATVRLVRIPARDGIKD